MRTLCRRNDRAANGRDFEATNRAQNLLGRDALTCEAKTCKAMAHQRSINQACLAGTAGCINARATARDLSRRWLQAEPMRWPPMSWCCRFPFRR